MVCFGVYPLPTFPYPIKKSLRDQIFKRFNWINCKMDNRLGGIIKQLPKKAKSFGRNHFESDPPAKFFFVFVLKFGSFMRGYNPNNTIKLPTVQLSPNNTITPDEVYINI